MDSGRIECGGVWSGGERVGEKMRGPTRALRS